jgi:hypothetical protein
MVARRESAFDGITFSRAQFKEIGARDAVLQFTKEPELPESIVLEPGVGVLPRGERRP